MCMAAGHEKLDKLLESYINSAGTAMALNRQEGNSAVARARGNVSPFM